MIHSVQHFLIYSLAFGLILWQGCTSESSPQKQADLILSGGAIYTAQKQNPNAEAVAVADGRILFVGSLDEAEKLKSEKTKWIDLKGNTLLPGFIESHGHLYNFGYSMMQLDLRPCESFEEVLEMVKEAVENTEPGQWITGRGWHEGKWDSLPPDNLTASRSTNDCLKFHLGIPFC